MGGNLIIPQMLDCPKNPICNFETHSFTYFFANALISFQIILPSSRKG